MRSGFGAGHAGPGGFSGGSELGHACAWLEYIGRTALVLTGPVTGHRYRFEQPGARLPVDCRDEHSLRAVPVLRSVTA